MSAGPFFQGLAIAVDGINTSTSPAVVARAHLTSEL